MKDQKKYRDNLTIAIDGFSSTGKSTYAKRIAKAIDYLYVDSGSMYRAVTLYAIEKGLFDNGREPGFEEIISLLPEIDIFFRKDSSSGDNYICLGNRIIEKEIRTMKVSGNVSYVSTIPQVRHAMVDIQRKMSKKGGVVMDGRDIGTVVFPQAEIKIFMTASPEIRAERRFLELREKGTEETMEKVRHNINERDRIDSGRETSPLKQADDAVLLDNSHMTIDEQMTWFFETFNHILIY